MTDTANNLVPKRGSRCSLGSKRSIIQASITPKTGLIG